MIKLFFMKINKIILTVLLVGLPALLFAQTGVQEVMQGRGNFLFNASDATFSRDIVRFNADNQETGLPADGIDYNNIKGSPFWADASMPARLYNSHGYLTTLPVRINLATNKIYFLKDSVEMVLNDNIVNRIVFMTENDSAVFIGQVPELMLNNKKLNDFVQVLNVGKYQLLKYTRRRVSSSESASRTSINYYFSDNVNYFIKSNERVEELKRLTRDNLLTYLPSSLSYDGWIKENNINFKNEKDIVRFLNQYNTRLNN